MKYLLVLIALFLTGCSWLTKREITQVPVITPPSTNVVTITNRPEPVIVYVSTTNTLHEVETRYVTNTPPPQIITQMAIQPPVTNYLSVTNYVPNPGLMSALETAKTVNQSVNVTPTSAPINLGLSALAGLATLAAAWQNRKATGAASALATARNVASTIIKTIEKMPENAATKAAVQDAAVQAGVADDVHAAVKLATN